MSNTSTVAMIMKRDGPVAPLAEVGRDEPDQSGGCPNHALVGSVAESGVESDAAGVEPLCAF